MSAQPSLADVMAQIKTLNATVGQLVAAVNALSAAQQAAAPKPATVTLSFDQPANSQFLPLT